jgi:hypothetical protein
VVGVRSGSRSLHGTWSFCSQRLSRCRVAGPLRGALFRSILVLRESPSGRASSNVHERCGERRDDECGLRRCRGADSRRSLRRSTSDHKLSRRVQLRLFSDSGGRDVHDQGLKTRLRTINEDAPCRLPFQFCQPALSRLCSSAPRDMMNSWLSWPPNMARRTRLPRVQSGRSLRSARLAAERPTVRRPTPEKEHFVKNRISATAFALLTVLTSSVALARDVYVVRFNTVRELTFFAPPCSSFSYQDHLFFYNAGPGDATVELLSVSNGAATNPRALTIPAGKARSSDNPFGGGDSATSSWAPNPQPLLWVAHLEVPDRVQVISKLWVVTSEPVSCPALPVPPGRAYTGARMPVIQALTPAGVPQVHLGTDIGSSDLRIRSENGRTNVGIFNAGSVAAAAVVELRRACDGGLVASQAATIPANSILQLLGFSSVFQGCTTSDTAGFESYVVVTVDQPSFSYAVTLSNDRPPFAPVSSSP